MKSWQQRERALATLAKETGYVRKPHGDRLRVALAFPEHLLGRDVEPRLPDVYRLFNAEDDIVCERVFLPPKQELAELLGGEGAAPDARVADAGRRFRRDRVLGVLRVGLRERADAAAAGRHSALRRRAHRRAIRWSSIGGAVTFVNPEPLAPFADVIAAGEGEVLVPALRRAFRAATGSRRPAAAAGHGARLLRAVVLRAAVRRRRHAGRLLVRAGASRRRCRSGRPRVKTTDALDPPATSIFTPDTEFGSRFLVEVVRGCANLCRFCWAGYNYLPVRAFPTDRILAARRSGARAREPRRPRVDRALRPSRTSSGSWRGCYEMGYAISPASLRLDDLTEPIVRVLRESGERTHHDRAGDRLRSPAPRHQQDGDQRRDSRSRRSDLRERHREPEAVLHDRPPDRDRRRPGGDSRSDAADARADAEARARRAARSAASSAA